MMGQKGIGCILGLVMALTALPVIPACAQDRHFGVRPPTPEEQAYIGMALSPVSKVVPNELSRRRAAREAERARTAGRPAAITVRPAAVDNTADASTRQFFPPIGEQKLNDCVAWAASYYYSTYTQAKDEGVDVSTGDTQHICSPAFTFHLYNEGHPDIGLTMAYVMRRLNDTGCASLSAMPYDPMDGISWPSKEAWIDALQNRTQCSHVIDCSTADGLEAVRQHLANGELAVTYCSLYLNLLVGYDLNPEEGPGVSNEVYYAPVGNLLDHHAVAIVGYDDGKEYTDPSDGGLCHGAFLMANSWGPSWGVTNSAGSGSKGFFWVAYTMFRKKSFGPLVYFNEDRPQYRPRLYLVAEVAHPRSGDLVLRGGISGWASLWQSYSVLGPFDDRPITESNPIAIDMTDGLSSTIGEGLSLLVSLDAAVGSWSSNNATLVDAKFYEDTDGDGSYGVSWSPLVPVTILPYGAAADLRAPYPPLLYSSAWAPGYVLYEPQGWGVTERVSVPDYPTQQSSGSSVLSWPSINDDGRYVAFCSDARDLTLLNTNGVGQVYLRDRFRGVTLPISVCYPYFGAGMGNDRSFEPAVSPNGRFVAFSSAATNLVLSDSNRLTDVFLCDRGSIREEVTTERISLGISGAEANGGSYGPGVSATGRFVAFWSRATNLVAGDGNGAADVFVRDRVMGTTERVNVSSTGVPALHGDSFFLRPAISPDGRFVAFESSADNLVLGDTNGEADVFLRDRQAGTTECISVNSLGQQSNGFSSYPMVTPDGRYVAFYSEASNLVPGDTNDAGDIFVRDRLQGTTERVSITHLGAQTGEGAGGDDIAITPDGRLVAFSSYSGDLVSDDTNGTSDVFIRDRVTNWTLRVSETTLGGQASGGSFLISNMSTLGMLAFTSAAADLVPGDTNGKYDVFVHGHTTGSHRLWIKATPSDSRPKAGDQVVLTTAVEDEFGDPVTGWRWSDGGAGGAFSPSATVQSPTYTAPDGPTSVVLNVVAACDGLPPVYASASVELRVDPSGVFPDVPASFWAFPQVMACYRAGIVGGYADGTYRPSDPVDRAAMAVFVSRGMAGCDAAIPDAGCDTPPFPDVICEHWARKYIVYAASHGVVGGYPDGTYQPGALVDRAQMAVFMARAMTGGDANVPPGPGTAFFPDVPTTHWAFKYVEYIHSQSVTGGYPDGTYRPTLGVTRDQMAVYVARAFALPM